MDRQEMERRLQVVAAYRASGQKANVWGEANGVALRVLSSWCAHSRRWQARLDGVGAAALTTTTRPSGFVAARVTPAAASSSVRVELDVGPTRLALHWPLAHMRELAALLHELGR
jgi:ADP-ribosylglycohydrolase